MSMRMLLPLLTLVMCHCFAAPTVTAAEWKDKAESEGKVILYTTMTSEHAKLFMESFRQLYPRIDAQSFTAGSSPLAERILTEARTGNFLWDVLVTTRLHAVFMGASYALRLAGEKILPRGIQGSERHVDLHLH